MTDSLTMAADEGGLADKLCIVRRQHLHIKRVLLKHNLLTG